MQSVAMQMKKNDQAAVVSMAAPSLYCRKPSWMVGSCALSRASADPSGGRTAPSTAAAPRQKTPARATSHGEERHARPPRDGFER